MVTARKLKHRLQKIEVQAFKTCVCVCVRCRVTFLFYRDSIQSSNEQLLSVLSDLVRTNHKCEELIAKRLENLPIMSSDGSQEQRKGQSPAAEG